MKVLKGKVLEVDVDSLREKIEDTGAEKVFGEEVNLEFYDFDNGEIEDYRQVRFRSVGDHSFITRKTDVEDDRAKLKDDIEFDVERKKEARKFLKSIGLEKIESGEKRG